MEITGRVEIELEFKHLSSEEWVEPGASSQHQPGENPGVFPGENFIDSSEFRSEEFYSESRAQERLLGVRRRSVSMKRSRGGHRHSLLRTQAQELLQSCFFEAPAEHHHPAQAPSCWFQEDSSSESEWEVDEEGPQNPGFFTGKTQVNEDSSWGFPKVDESCGWNESLWATANAAKEDDESWKEVWSVKPSDSEKRAPMPEESCEGIQWKASREFARALDRLEFPESESESEKDEEVSDGELDEAGRVAKEWKQEGSAAREKAAYEQVLKAMEEDDELRKIYLQRKKSGPFWCMVCYAWGRRKMFPNLNSLIRHAQSVKRTNRKSEHRGYARAVHNYVLLSTPQVVRKMG